MDEQQKAEKAAEDLSTTEELIVKVTEERKIDDAGPSRATNLPGAIQSPRPKQGQKTGLSKSDHCIPQIITSKDVTNALKSLSFGPANQGATKLHVPELKIPTLESQLADKNALDTTTLVDLKKFISSCFKLSKETPVVVAEIPLQAENSNISSNTEAECTPKPNLANDVVVKGAIEPKISKSDKKKAGLSERSDLAVAQRDSLSSIGSNVCRICMTRGRER